ncbi:MAG: TadE/TadG family type IV pilus assembly protein [Bradymonadaceae bacterium]
MRPLLKYFIAFHRHQRGSTLTEFIITLPIFILVFVGILQLGAMERVAGELWGQAYRDTWTQALTVVDGPVMAIDHSNPFDIHIDPDRAGQAALADLALQPPRNDHRFIEANVALSESDTYRNMRSSGHWGESFARTNPTRDYVNMRHVDEYGTARPGDIIGESELADALFNDNPTTATVVQGGHSPTLGPLPISGSGFRPVLAAGMRYGAVMGTADAEYDALGWKVHVGTEYSALVPPVPVDNARQTTAIVRQALEAYNPYRELLGIAKEQPLRRETAAGGFSFGDD